MTEESFLPKIEFRPATRDAHYDRASRQEVQPPNIRVSTTDTDFDVEAVTSAHANRSTQKDSSRRNSRVSYGSGRKTGSDVTRDGTKLSVKDPYSYLNQSSLGSFAAGGKRLRHTCAMTSLRL